MMSQVRALYCIVILSCAILQPACGSSHQRFALFGSAPRSLPLSLVSRANSDSLHFAECTTSQITSGYDAIFQACKSCDSEGKGCGNLCCFYKAFSRGIDSNQYYLCISRGCKSTLYFFFGILTPPEVDFLLLPVSILLFIHLLE
jgi:hypothetical protein